MIVVDPEAHRHFRKSCSVPYTMRAQVEKELNRLQAEGIINPVQFADWAVPIVAVLESDGNIFGSVVISR